MASDAASPVNDGGITFREAIDYVNGDPVPIADQGAFDYANLGTNDTILFNLPTGQNTIALTAGELGISESVIIDTEGQDITIDANDPTPMQKNGDGIRIFNITGGDVTLKHLTLLGVDLDNLVTGTFGEGAIRGVPTRLDYACHIHVNSSSGSYIAALAA